MNLDPEQPHSARMYDYLLGGKDNFDADRQAVRGVLEAWPNARLAARENRAFMHRAVRWLAQTQGITQFLDIGTGIPTEPNLHQIAQQAAPEARVVYVDNDPMVLTHARALMTSTPEGATAYIDADAANPDTILSSQELICTLDLRKPVAVSLVALLHFIPDNREPLRIVETLMDAMPSGSWLTLSHVTPDFAPEAIAAVEEIYRTAGVAAQVRSRAEFARFFRDLQLEEPGIVSAHRWMPDRYSPLAGDFDEWADDLDPKLSLYVGVARKP